MAGNTATIVLKADSKGIKKGTDELKRLEQQSGRTEKSTKRVSTSMARMGRVAGVAAIAMAGLFARAVLKHTIAQEHSIAQLNASLRSTGRFTEETSKALQDYAADLQRVTTFGDDAIIMLESQILTFKNISGEVLPETTEAMLDLAVKMKGDLKGAAVLLGKALNDPATGLSYLTRVGITFTQAQQDVIKKLQSTNKLTDAQRLILKELNTEFGGSARAARNTFGGALDAVSLAFTDMLEVSGDETSGAIGALNDLAALFEDPVIADGWRDMAEGVIYAVEALARIPQSVEVVKRGVLDILGIIDEGTSVSVIKARMKELNDELINVNKVIDDGGDIYGSSRDRRADIQIELAGLRNQLKIKERIARIEAQQARDTAASRIKANLGGGAAGVELSPEQIRARTTAQERLTQSLNDYAAEVGGPVVVAAQAYAAAMADIDRWEKTLIANGGITLEQKAELLEAENNAVAQLHATIAALEEETVATEDLDVAFEGLTQQQALFLEASANLADTATDFFMAFADGSLNAKEAFSGFAKSVLADIARMIIQQTILNAVNGFLVRRGILPSGILPNQRRGGFNTSMSDVPSVNSGLATGGGVGAGINQVNEFGPELLSTGGKDYLLSNQNGRITPADKVGSSSVVVNIDARQNLSPASLLALSPVIQAHVEQGIATNNHRLSRGYR